MADGQNSQMETEEVDSQAQGSETDPGSSTPGLKKPAAKTKAEPKVKGAAKAAVKALAKGKAASKAPSSMKVLKKPASAKPPPVQKPAMKKPASCKAAAASTLWKHGSKSLTKQDEEEENHEEHGEEEEPEDDPAMDIQEKFAMDTSTKDRSKDFKFKQMLAQNNLPTWLKEAYQKTLTMKSGRIAEQRRLVNLALDRKPDGALVLSLEKPEFRELKDNFVTCEHFVHIASVNEYLHIYIYIYRYSHIHIVNGIIT